MAAPDISPSGHMGTVMAYSVAWSVAANKWMPIEIAAPVAPFGLARVKAAASTNITQVASAPCEVGSIFLSNVAITPRFFKLYNKATLPALATDVPVATVVLPANFAGNVNVPCVKFSAGLAYAITASVLDTDATGIALNDVHGFIAYR